MQQYITVDDLKALSPQAQQRLEAWFVESLEWDDDPVYVYIPQEAINGHDGIFKGEWATECEFQYPQDYRGKISSHEGTVLPIMDIQQMLQFLDANDNEDLAFRLYRLIDEPSVNISHKWTLNSALFCQSLWEGVKSLLEKP